MTSATVQWPLVLSACSVPVYFALAFVLYKRGLWRAYIFFWVFLLVEGAALAASIYPVKNRNITGWIYIIAQPPLWILNILMVMELFRKVLKPFPHVAKWAQGLVILSLMVALALSFLSLNADLTAGRHGSLILLRYTAIERAVTSALSLHLILMAALLLWLPIPLPPNTIRHSFLFFFYFFLNAVVHYYWNTSQARHALLLQVNLLIGAITLGSLVAWHFLLVPEGEKFARPYTRAHGQNAGEMLDRLEALNKSLSRGGA